MVALHDGEPETGYHEWVLRLLKIGGVVLFIWILSRIDRSALLLHLRNAEPIGIAASFLGLFLMYTLKAARWHVLVRTTGLTPSWMDSWHLFNIGIFLGAITPASMGEMGRAAYLRRMGLHTGTALAIPFIDRIADVIIMGAVGVWGVWLLFGWQWSLLAASAGMIVLATILFLWQRATGLRAKEWLAFIGILSQPSSLMSIFFWTVLSWIAYFGWTFLLAGSIDINVSPPVLMAALTLTGILVFIPIAPSGLGTREAALITFLTPYGVPSTQTVTLSLLMFTSIILSVLPGALYWLRNRQLQ